MKKIKEKYMWIIGVVVIVLLLLPFIYFGVSHYTHEILKHKKVEKYYKANIEGCDEIVRYFENLYKENLYTVEFDCDTNCLELKFKYVDKNGGNDYSTEKVDCANEAFIKELLNLQEKYQKDCDYPVFSYIGASYDAGGNMLLHMQGYSRKISEEERRCYYLVYIEEEYSGRDPSLEIDMRYMNEKPFKGNWYTWSEDWPFG